MRRAKHLARRTDPATSHQAAARATTFLRGHAAQIVEALETIDRALTYYQIAERCGLQPVQVHRRLAALVDAGRLIECGAKECPLAGSTCMTFRAARATTTDTPTAPTLFDDSPQRLPD